MDLRELDSGVDPATHWYYRAKGLPLLRFFRSVSDERRPTALVDIGAGSGVFSELLLARFGARLRGVVRVDLHYPADTISTDARMAEGAIEHRRDLPATIDSAVLLLTDVLEHVADDGAFLDAIVARCEGSCHFFITVPASQRLWSRHDEFLGHYRRYSRQQLVNVVRRSGIDITRAYYFFAFAFPFVYVARRVMTQGDADQTDLKPCAPWLNWVLTALGRCESLWCRLNRWFGVTVVLEGHLERPPARLSGSARTTR